MSRSSLTNSPRVYFRPELFFRVSSALVKKQGRSQTQNDQNRLVVSNMGDFWSYLKIYQNFMTNIYIYIYYMMKLLIIFWIMIHKFTAMNFGTGCFTTNQIISKEIAGQAKIYVQIRLRTWCLSNLHAKVMFDGLSMDSYMVYGHSLYLKSTCRSR